MPGSFASGLRRKLGRVNDRRELLHVVAVMAEVVRDEEAQGDRLVVANHAGCVQALFGDAVHDGDQDFLFYHPPAEQRRPRLIGVPVRRDPCVLFVFRSFIASVDGGTHEALPVVGRRVEQMSDDLLACPAADAPGFVRNLGWKGMQGVMKIVHPGAKLVSKLGWQVSSRLAWSIDGRCLNSNRTLERENKKPLAHAGNRSKISGKSLLCRYVS